MNAIFISDAHILDHDDPGLPPLLDFLDYLIGRTEHLYVLGDLFDTWFAFPRAVFEEYVPVLGALDRLHRGGVDITYVTGNHDFEMGHFFEGMLDADVHDTDFAFEADGRRVFAAHGDMVDPSDRSYLRFRRILRNRFTRWLGRNLPPFWIWRFGQWLSSRSKGERDAPVEPIRRLFEDYCRARVNEGHDTVILGHLHVPLHLAPIGDTGRDAVNLGDWIRHRTYLEWDDGDLRLMQWQWPEKRATPFEA